MSEGKCRPIVALLGTLAAVQDRLEAVLEPVGLSLAKFNAISQLYQAQEPLPLSALAERCACVRSNITQLVDRLESDELVVRSHDPRDRRSVRAELTAEGRARYSSGKKILDEAELRLFEPLNPQQQEELMATLAALRSAL
jgi:MarR family 2-MHQ and catechol resistance regulon transcriptional repressor